MTTLNTPKLLASNDFSTIKNSSRTGAGGLVVGSESN